MQVLEGHEIHPHLLRVQQARRTLEDLRSRRPRDQARPRRPFRRAPAVLLEAPPWAPRWSAIGDRADILRSLCQSVGAGAPATDIHQEFRCELRGLAACSEYILDNAIRWARRPDTCRPRVRECVCAPFSPGSWCMPGNHARLHHLPPPQLGRRGRLRTRHGLVCPSLLAACDQLRWRFDSRGPTARSPRRRTLDHVVLRDAGEPRDLDRPDHEEVPRASRCWPKSRYV